MAGRIVLFGATGYTGALTAAELGSAGVPVVLAARNRKRVEELAQRVGGTSEVAVADVDQPETIRALLGRGDVLISTVGPFVQLGQPALDAALDAGAHYIDSTGEPAFIRRVFEEFAPAAEKAGVTLLTAFGYDYVPGHVAGGLAVEAGGAAVTQVDIGYFASGLRPSGGTMRSAAGIMRSPSYAWRDGRLVTERNSKRVLRFDLGRRTADAVSMGGSENIALPRSYPELVTVGTYLGWFGGVSRALPVLGAGQAALDRVPGFSGLTDRAVARFLPGSTGGPDLATRARARSIIVAVARDRTGRELRTVRLRGIDPYTLTARLLAWAAVRLRDEPPPGGGARGPVEAFGLETMTRALADSGLPQVDAN